MSTQTENTKGQRHSIPDHVSSSGPPYDWTGRDDRLVAAASERGERPATRAYIHTEGGDDEMKVG
jgi:hypothetical protein